MSKSFIKKCDAAAEKAAVKVANTCAAVSAKNEGCGKLKGIALTTAALFSSLFSATSVCFADIIDDAGSQANSYYGKLVGIAGIIAVFCITIAILWTMISPTSKGAATPIGWIKKIIVAYILLCVIGGIFTVIGNITNGYDYKYKG